MIDVHGCVFTNLRYTLSYYKVYQGLDIHTRVGSVLLVQLQWALPEPQDVGRVTDTASHAFFISLRIRTYTLINVDNRQGDNSTTSAQSPLSTISCKTIAGVSVGNAFRETTHWYVLRVSYNREEKAFDWLKGKGMDVFLPLRNDVRMADGKRKTITKPLIPNIIFVRSTLTVLDNTIHNPANSCLSYYYNHFTVRPDGKNPPLIIPDSQMDDFIRVASVNDPNILFLSHDDCHFKSGDQVIVTAGPFKGITGRVIRAKRQQRVAIEIAGLGVVTTAYVPSGCMRKIFKKLYDIG